jgi:hypothetical protein
MRPVERRCSRRDRMRSLLRMHWADTEFGYPLRRAVIRARCSPRRRPIRRAHPRLGMARLEQDRMCYP